MVLRFLPAPPPVDRALWAVQALQFIFEKGSPRRATFSCFLVLLVIHPSTSLQCKRKLHSRKTALTLPLKMAAHATEPTQTAAAPAQQQMEQPAQPEIHNTEYIAHEPPAYNETFEKSQVPSGHPAPTAAHPQLGQGRMVVPLERLGEEPALVDCPYCRMTTTTRVGQEHSTMTVYVVLKLFSRLLLMNKIEWRESSWDSFVSVWLAYLASRTPARISTTTAPTAIESSRTSLMTSRLRFLLFESRKCSLASTRQASRFRASNLARFISELTVKVHGF